MEDTLILYPIPAMGHIVSMVEFAKHILHHHPSFSITIIILTTPFSNSSINEYIASVSSTTPVLNLRHIQPSSPLTVSSTRSVEEEAFEFVRLGNANLNETIQTMISMSTKIKALVLDFFCFSAMDVAERFEIPTYFFFTSNLTSLSALLYFPTIHETTTGNLKDFKTLLEIPSLPPIPVSEFFEPMLVRDTQAYREFLNCSLYLSKSKGIVVNSFSSLESKALKAISDGLCYSSSNRPTPAIFTAGPLISSKKEDGEEHECLRWLSSQPSKSVVFVCFGSKGQFTAEQLTDMAVGLENSGQRFLWVAKLKQPSKENNKAGSGTILNGNTNPNLEEILPTGFLERTKQRGMVIKTWVPQVAVLNHDSVGGFVTHCGWNSVLEAICAGVPMVAWPLFAEQRMNKVWLVEEVKVGLAVSESINGLVSGTELEERIKQLMESEEGKRARDRILVLQAEAMAAQEDGGSSITDLAQLVKLWKS